MNKKWYFGALTIILIVLGVYQNGVSGPNQEVVLKFSDANITSDEAQSAIMAVKNQLQTIGIDAVQVQELSNGEFKITYYSATDVEFIKEKLSESKALKSGYLSANKHERSPNDDSKQYKLDVFEIHKGNDVPSGLDGKCVLNVKQDFDRFYNPNLYNFNNEIDAKDEDKTVKVAFKVCRTIAVALDTTSRNIPEVRAGPLA
ncbi:hypothetical protein [Snuella sedimenti]|uniref:Uncharacterized protein n=1 Tax=Snuella sedimenti TaxID=2798802 RepID=A0A8J7IUJ6_9FLAO|nr:hypothetical protein [Snuella sedimenti]MBJ6366940.1 hypothetical protein [Snuella sedimenti]